MALRLLSLLSLSSTSFAQYSLWPTFDASALATYIGISNDCLEALNETVSCSPTLFKRTTSVDYYFWTTENVTTLCTTECIESAASWNDLVISTCSNETYYYNNKAVPADTIPGRHVEGLNLACMTNSESSSCLVESQSWVGSGMIYNSDGTLGDDQSLTTLYDNATLCDECFIDMLTARVNSSYLGASTFNDYMSAELWAVLEWCDADTNITLQAYATYASSTGPPVVSTTATSVVSSAIATATCTGQTVSFSSLSAASSTSTASSSTVITDVKKRQLLSGVSADPNITQACLDISLEYYVPTGAVIIAAGSSDCSNMTAVTCLPAECDIQLVTDEYSTCDLLASDLTVANNTVTTVQLLTWNPAIIGTCDSLQVGQYVCITPPGGAWTPTIANITNSTSDDSGGVTQSFATTFLTATATNNITTPTPIQTGMTTSCDVFYFVEANDECDTIASEYDITLAEFYAWNPAVGTDCSILEVGTYVCVDILSNTTATTTSSITTPSPIQTGITSSCDEFYLVVSGDECSTIADQYSITLADFYDWNPAVGTSCANLELGEYVCVAISTSSVTSGGITTPSPIQTSMPSTCDEFHLVVSGDTCSVVASEYGLTLSQFYSWNPAVGSDCSTLDLGDYVCVHVSVTTPSPIQTSMYSECDSFYLVQSGDSCDAIATAESISLASLYAWNPAVGTSCADLYLSYYICVGVEPTPMTTLADTVAKRTIMLAEAVSMITPAPKARLN